jgi:hypothetical protein
MLFMKKQHMAHALTLCSVAFLVACGGGGGDGGAGPTTLNGVALKGPLNNAMACADVNGNGLCDDGAANQVRTNPDGSFTLNLALPVPILVVTDANTKDDRGNKMTEGTVLKAPAGSTVVSVATTMISAGATNDQVATALGYPIGTDFKNLNPFKTGGSNADQYKFETSAMQVYTAISAIASGASSTGASSGAAFDGAFKALADKAKAATSSINFSSPAEIDDIAGRTKANMANVSGFDAVKFESARTDMKAAVANVNTKIQTTTIDNFKSADTSNLYAVASKNVSDQVASRVTSNAPMALADTANIDAVLTEQKKAASTTLAKISDMVGFWEGTFGDLTAGAVVLGDGTAWVVVNGTVPRVVKATLAVNGGMLSGTGLGYAVGGATTAPVAMTASLDSAKLKGSLTSAKREVYEFNAANASVYATAATLGSFAKTWSGVNSGRTMAWTFSSTGALTGSSGTTGCSYTGQLTLRSEAKAVVNALVAETCPGASAAVTYNGIAYINKDSQAVFTLLSNQGPVLLRF